MLTVDVLALRGASPSSVAITFEVLETANRVLASAGRPAAFAVRARGSGADAAAAFAGVEGADDGRPADLVITPGLALSDEAALGEGLARPDVQAAREAVAAAAARGAEVAGSCSGVFLLAAAGVLDGRRATTSWWLAPLFRRMFPAVALETGPLVVRDGPVTTAGAAMAQLDLMLALVGSRAGAGVAAHCARYLVMDERRSQLPYMAVGLLAASDEIVARADAWARARLEQGLRVEEMAAAVGLTPRTFARRVERATGLSPVRFLQRLRIERAAELLATTRLSFEAIAHRVGYAEPSTLRRLMQAEGALRPPRPGREAALEATSRRARAPAR